MPLPARPLSRDPSVYTFHSCSPGTFVSVEVLNFRLVIFIFVESFSSEAISPIKRVVKALILSRCPCCVGGDPFVWFVSVCWIRSHVFIVSCVILRSSGGTLCSLSRLAVGVFGRVGAMVISAILWSFASST